jgi:hypothetical protein
MVKFIAREEEEVFIKRMDLREFDAKINTIMQKLDSILEQINTLTKLLPEVLKRMEGVTTSYDVIEAAVRNLQKYGGMIPSTKSD